MMKKLLLALLVATLPTLASAQTRLNNYQPGYRLIDGSQLNKAVSAINDVQGNGTSRNLNAAKIITNTNPPVLTSCGTNPAIVGSNVAGLVTMGTGSPTGCIITFANAYTGVPFCTVTWQATPLASQSYTTTATAITLVQTATSSNLVNYNCVARTGG